MPARKSPLGFKQRHYDAEQVRDMFSVSLSKAYDIIHQCKVYGEVIKAGGSLRVSETALTNRRQGRRRPQAARARAGGGTPQARQAA